MASEVQSLFLTSAVSLEPLEGAVFLLSFYPCPLPLYPDPGFPKVCSGVSPSRPCSACPRTHASPALWWLWGQESWAQVSPRLTLTHTLPLLSPFLVRQVAGQNCCPEKTNPTSSALPAGGTQSPPAERNLLDLLSPQPPPGSL